MEVTYKNLLDIERLYYSLVISIKIFNKYGDGDFSDDMTLHIDNWLRAAKEQSLFNAFVLPDIEWLLEENSLREPDKFINITETICNKCNDILEMHKPG